MTELNSLIREVASEFPDAHPHKLAKLVAERTEPELMFDFYVVALERLVADRIRLDRNATMNSGKSRSPKLEERRTWWARMLAERVHVGDSKWKPLGDCTVDDIDFCISERNDQVGALLGQIAKFETIRDAMLSHSVVTAAELPDGAVEL